MPQKCVDDAIIDGEVIAADETGRPQFYDLLRGTRAPAYVAFDIVWLNASNIGSRQAFCLITTAVRFLITGPLPKHSPCHYPHILPPSADLLLRMEINDLALLQVYPAADGHKNRSLQSGYSR